MFELDAELSRRVTRRQVLQRMGAGGAALALPALLAACGSSDKTGTGGTGGVGTDAPIGSLTWAVGPPAPSLDLASGFVLSGMVTMAVGLEGLLTVGDDLTLKPLLAESWDRPDALHYVYRIRSGVRFWDGTPLTAADVAYSLNRHLDPSVASQAAPFYANVASIKVTGPNEVTVTMKAPDPNFQYVPVFSYVTPQRFSERLGKKLGAPGSTVNTMGTGPFRIASFSPDAATVVRNEDYWGQRPTVRRASLKYIGDPQTQLLAMRSGEIDGAFQFPLSQAQSWDRLPGTETAYAPGLAINYLSFDLSAPPWNDLHVRRAVAYAADRAGFVRAFLGGHGTVATTFPAPAGWGGLVPRSELEAIYKRLPSYDYDLTRARQELAQSSHPHGFSTDIQFPTGYPEVGKALVSLSETLKGIGIHLRVHEVSVAKYQADLLGHKDLGLQYGGLAPDYADASDYLAQVLPSAGAVPNGFNTANFKDARVDKLLAQQAAATDRAQRAQYIEQILKIIGEELPYLPLWWQDSTVAIKSKYVYPGFNSLFYSANWLAKIRVRAT